MFRKHRKEIKVLAEEVKGVRRQSM